MKALLQVQPVVVTPVCLLEDLAQAELDQVELVGEVLAVAVLA